MCAQSHSRTLAFFKIVMNLFVFRGGRRPKDNKLPSMTEVVPQLSVEDIFRDYCRGVLHPSRPGMYDPDHITDDNFDVPEIFDDFSDLYEQSLVPSPVEEDLPPAQEDPSVGSDVDSGTIPET